MSSVVPVVAQRRRNRQFVAMHVAPRAARPQALRDLYRDAGSIRRTDGRPDNRPETRTDARPDSRPDSVPTQPSR